MRTARQPWWLWGIYLWKELPALRAKFGPNPYKVIGAISIPTRQRDRRERLRATLRQLCPVQCEHRGPAWEDQIIATYNANRHQHPEEGTQAPKLDRFPSFVRQGFRFMECMQHRRPAGSQRP